MVPLPFSRTRLFGPLLLYDLVRTARRRQCVVVRCLYLALLLTTLVCVSVTWAFQKGSSVWTLFEGTELRPAEISDLTAQFFYFFLAGQLLFVFLFTPAYVAGAIGEEKEHRTLEFLLATDLRNREIVLSLLVSRVASLVLVLLAGLPFLSLLQLLGGVDPDLLLAGFAFSGLTMAGLAGLAVLCSVSAQRAREAIVRTYLWALAYLLVSGVSWMALIPDLGWAKLPSTAAWTSPVTVQDVVEWFNAGNPFSVTVRCLMELNAGKPLSQVLPGFLSGYAWFQGLAAALCIAIAVARLRAEATENVKATDADEGGARRRPPVVSANLGFFRIPRRPRVGKRPLLWKELFTECGRTSRLGRVGMGVLVLASFLPPAIVLYLDFVDGRPLDLDRYRDGMSVWVQLVSAVVGTLMLLQVGLRAAGAVSGERDRQTLDSLLATPLDASAILLAKLAGSFFCPRKSVIWLAAVWLVGFLMGGLDLSAVPWFLLGWGVFAAFEAALGLWFSTAARTMQRATLWTLLATAAFWGGHWLLWVALVPFAQWVMQSSLALEWLGDFQKLALTPPLTLHFLTFGREPYRVGFGARDWFQVKMMTIQLGLLLWGVAAVLVWALASARFHRDIGRPRRSRKARRALAAGATRGPGAEPAEPFAAAAPPMPFVAMPPDPGSKSALPATGPTDQTKESPSKNRAASSRNRRKRILFGLALGSGIMTAAGGSLALNDMLDRRVQTAIAEADRLDPGWRQEERGARPGVVAEDRGPTLVLEKLEQWPWLARSLPEPEVLIGTVGPEVRLDTSQVSAVASQIEKMDPLLEEVRRLAHYPGGRWAIARSRGLPDRFQIYGVVRWLALDMLLRAQNTPDCDDALESCLAAFNACSSRGSTLSPWEIQLQLQRRHLVLGQTERALAQTRPSEQELALAQRAMEPEAAFPLLLAAQRFERRRLDRLLYAIQVGEAPITGSVSMAGSSWGSELTARVLTTSVKNNRAASLLYMNGVVEIAKLPVDQQLPELKKLEVTLPTQPYLVRHLVPSFFGEFTDCAKHGTELRCAVVMLALERYRVKHQRWPAS